MKFGMQVVMTANKDKGDELAKLMQKASQLVSDIKACEFYLVQLSTSEDDTVLITEVWQSQEDHQASLLNADVRELIAKAKPLIAGMSYHKGRPLE